MAFVKLDCGLLDSTLWIDREAREVFITALLMASPYELKEPTPQIKVRELDHTGFNVPAGWYGFVPAAGTGIVRRSGLEPEAGLNALERLGDPDTESRTPDFDGRRLVRVDGGYLVLNFIRYREKDATTADRSKRYRERKRELAESRRDVTMSHRDDTASVTPRHQAEAEAEADKKEKRAFAPPSLESVKLQAAKIGLPEHEAEAFHAHHEAGGWRMKTGPMRSWTAALTKWNLNWRKWSGPTAQKAKPAFAELRDLEAAIAAHPANPESVRHDPDRTEAQCEELDALKLRLCELRRANP